MAKQNYKKSVVMPQRETRNDSNNTRLLTNKHIAIKQCRDGLFMYNLNDLFISRSLDVYGEWCFAETELLAQLIHQGDVVVDVGANIGTHSVFFGNKVGSSGKVYSFEPQRITFEFLCSNIALNGLTNVVPMQMGASDQTGEIVVPVLDPTVQQNFGCLNIEGHQEGDRVRIMPIDNLELSKCNLIKIDVEGMEVKVLSGAEKTIIKHKPFIFVENNNREGNPDLVQKIMDYGYNCWWQVANYYNPNNFFKNKENIWPNLLPEANMICISKTLEIDASIFEPVVSINDNWVQAVTRRNQKIQNNKNGVI